MSELLKITFLTSLLCILLLNVFSSFAPRLGLVDVPDERKTHKGHIPLVGGLSIYITFSISCLMVLNIDIEIKLFLIASGLMVFIGVLDDKYALSVRSRIIGQLLISSILVFGLGYISAL